MHIGLSLQLNFRTLKINKNGLVACDFSKYEQELTNSPNQYKNTPSFGIVDLLKPYPNI